MSLQSLSFYPPYNVARWAAPASFIFNLACQTYGLLAKPNLKDVNDTHLSFFSPAPLFVGIFFFSLQVSQLLWLGKLWRVDPRKDTTDRRESVVMTDFVPYLIVGNICTGAWTFFWLKSSLKISNIFVLIDTLVQLYYMFFRIQAMDLNSRCSILTSVVNKIFVGISVLDLLHNTSAAYYRNETASTAVRVLTGVGFCIGGACSDWILGAALVYDLVALALGQSKSWRMLLIIYAIGTGAIVAGKNLYFQPYERRRTVEYETIPDEDDLGAPR